MKALLLIADVFDGFARKVLDHLHGDGVGPAVFAGDDDAVRGRHRLACGANDPRIEALGQAFAIERIDHFIGNAIADFVRMAF